MKIKLFRRPGHKVKLVNSITGIISGLTGDWFTKDAAEYIPLDLYYQDMFFLFNKGEAVSFIIFTCIDGKITITLMATKPENRNAGYGTTLFRHFEKYVKEKLFRTILVQTVPQESNPNYRGTIAFYKKMGFEMTRVFKDLWETGAIQLEKSL